ncbi:hypothetical protein GCM10010401_09450 [Rarobacter faecitabidus]|uniref:Uncharacterized protein n=1 Tax=Rarobacter faecitabidus TaxID=13243 RepID=A0A542ZAH1_RARFA|nr:hypothetical protein [Rarobacter faecitabidus]TQL57230.1 hypothetical protein FB461_2351 [Rarobacter faecitabidus]
MRNKIAAALTAVALASGAAAVAPIAQASPEAPRPAVSAAPAVAAAKTTKTIVVKAKGRVNPEKLTVKQAAKAMKAGFVEVKGTAVNEAGFIVLMGVKKGNSAAGKLWKAKKGQKVRVATTKGKKLNVKVLKRVSGEDFAAGDVAVTVLSKTKAIIVIGASASSDAARVFLLG